MSLLFAERPLVINTQLAMKIGLNEAIVLQQLHYWLRDTNSGMECDGVRWIYNTTEQWLEQFPFWSESTLKRAFASLKTLGLLRCEKLNKSKRDMTNFYKESLPPYSTLERRSSGRLPSASQTRDRGVSLGNTLHGLAASVGSLYPSKVGTASSSSFILSLKTKNRRALTGMRMSS